MNLDNKINEEKQFKARVAFMGEPRDNARDMRAAGRMKMYDTATERDVPSKRKSTVFDITFKSERQFNQFMGAYDVEFLDRLDEATKKQNGEKAREVLTSAKVPHSMVMGTIRVPERFVRIAKEKLDDAFGGMFQKKTGFKISGTLKEDVQLDEAIAARDIQGMIKGLNKKAKQEIADVLNDMNLSGYGDYEARADNVHKFKPKDLLKAMNKVMKLEEKKLPTARKIVSGLGDADGPFTVVVMKNNKNYLLVSDNWKQ